MTDIKKTFCQRIIDILPLCCIAQPIKQKKSVRIAPEPTITHQQEFKRHKRLNSIEAMAIRHLIEDAKIRNEQA